MKSITVCAKEASTWSDALSNVRHLSSEGRYLFHACTVYLSCRALTGTPLAASRRRPTGFCLPQGLWHSHRASHVRELSVVFWLVGKKKKSHKARRLCIRPLSVFHYLWHSAARNPTTNTTSDAIDAADECRNGLG